MVHAEAERDIKIERGKNRIMKSVIKRSFYILFMVMVIALGGCSHEGAQDGAAAQTGAMDSGETAGLSAQDTQPAAQGGEDSREPATSPTATPTPTPVPLRKMSYHLDYHRVSPIYEKVFSPTIVEVTGRMIDAFLAGEKSIEVPSMTRSELEDVESLTRVMCPPIMGLVKCNVQKSYTKTTDVFTWEYRKSAEEIAQELETYEAEIYRYMDMLYEDDSEAMKALILFMEFAHATEYDDNLGEGDNDGLSEDERAYHMSGIWALVHHRAVCYGYGETLAFLYAQAGLDAVEISNFEGAHSWTMVRIDGKYYYMDATWSSTPEFYNLQYFGMTTRDREQWAGEYRGSDNTVCFYPVSKICELDDNRFDCFHSWNFVGISDYEVDHRAQIVKLYVDDIECKYDPADGTCDMPYEIERPFVDEE